MAKLPNLEKAKLESEAYAKMIRNMIDSLNSDLVDLKAKDDKVKLIPEEKEAPVRKMFGAAMRTMETNFSRFRAYVEPSASPSAQKRIKKKFNEIQRERMKFMGRASMQRGDKRTLEQKKNDGSREPMRGKDFGQAYIND